MRPVLASVSVLAMCATATAAVAGPAPAKVPEPERIACPARIEVSPQDLAKKITDWRYYDDRDSKYVLDTVGVSKGKKKLEKMEPDKGTESYSEWLLPDNGKETYFLVCSYLHTSIHMKRALPSKLKKCRVAYEPDPNNPHAPPVLHKFTCE